MLTLSRSVFVLALTLTLWAASAPAQPPSHIDNVWDPLARQEREGDTLFLLDGEAERLALLNGNPPGKGGLINGNALTATDTVWDGVSVVPGKYRPGLKSVRATNGYVWMPVAGIFDPKEFTVELWLQSSVRWDNAATGALLSLGQPLGRGGVRLVVLGKNLRLQYRATPDPRSAVTADIPYSLSVRPFPAGQWQHIAFTFRDGTLRFYVNGREVGSAANLPRMEIVPDSGIREGFTLLGNPSYGMTQFSVSDLRISRAARTPWQVIYPPAGNTLAVYADFPLRQGVQPLAGGLHTLTTPLTEQMAQGVVRVIRTDKLLSTTPIKAGDPDAAHPNRGITGRYSYDWQVVDRTMDYFVRIGVIPYISIDSTPQLLGGKFAPFSGQTLLTRRSYIAPFNATPPSDFAAFGDMTRDLVYHIVKEKRYRVPYWGVWNEPELSVFWNGSFDRYLALYEVCAQAVKSVDSSLKVGGPETTYQPAMASKLAVYCAQRGLPLDFLSWHFYSGSISDIGAMRRLADTLSAENGLPKMELVVGEWCWNISALPGGQPPWGATNSFIGDWHAAFVGASLIEMQRAGVAYAIYSNPVGDAYGQSFAGSSLMSEDNEWANLNVYRMWALLKPDVVRSEYDGMPGIYALASRDERGALTVMISSWRYHGQATSVYVMLPPEYAASAATQYLMDNAHSNAYDAGWSNVGLQSVRAVKYGAVAAVRLKPRSVALLTIEAPRR